MEADIPESDVFS